ncbi:MAG: hypothetical protein BA874_06190 [Desulfuromonadales bacterium C00003068]|jgi:hypothetical protein|nr:MAG: hypothetical protein BA874_06190 [Desulfuromonadales bacterium C00003068]
MTDPGLAVDSAAGALLSKEQVRTCQDLSSQEKGIVSQRAVALLNLNGGSTQTKAATVSGLTLGQVRYLLYTFRRKGMMIFSSGKEQTTQENISVSGSNSETSTIASERIADTQPPAEKKKKPGSKKDKEQDKGSKKKTKKKKNKKNAKKKKSKGSKKK